MYQKLNYLASVCAPDYSDAGYMRGNLISLTVGGWCYEQVGIMKGITLDVPTESPWEIGINDNDNTNDSSVKELPMIVKVTGFQFTLYTTLYLRYNKMGMVIKVDLFLDMVKNNMLL